MSKEQQAVYDVIKKVREGCSTPFSFDGVNYVIVPWESQEQEASDYCQLVLCKYHGTKIGIQSICWKDAGPNPRLDSGFIPFKNIYGVAIRTDDGDSRSKTQDSESESKRDGRKD